MSSIFRPHRRPNRTYELCIYTDCSAGTARHDVLMFSSDVHRCRSTRILPLWRDGYGDVGEKVKKFMTTSAVRVRQMHCVRRKNENRSVINSTNQSYFGKHNDRYDAQKNTPPLPPTRRSVGRLCYGTYNNFNNVIIILLYKCGSRARPWRHVHSSWWRHVTLLDAVLLLLLSLLSLMSGETRNRTTGTNRIIPKMYRPYFSSHSFVTRSMYIHWICVCILPLYGVIVERIYKYTAYLIFIIPTVTTHACRSRVRACVQVCAY